MRVAGDTSNGESTWGQNVPCHVKVLSDFICKSGTIKKKEIWAIQILLNPLVKKIHSARWRQHISVIRLQSENLDFFSLKCSYCVCIKSKINSNYFLNSAFMTSSSELTQSVDSYGIWSRAKPSFTQCLNMDDVVVPLLGESQLRCWVGCCERVYLFMSLSLVWQLNEEKNKAGDKLETCLFTAWQLGAAQEMSALLLIHNVRLTCGVPLTW